MSRKRKTPAKASAEIVEDDGRKRAVKAEVEEGLPERVPDDYFGAFAHPKKGRFLSHLAALGSIAPAARATGVSHYTPYTWMQSDPEFAEAVEAARDYWADQLELETYQAAQRNDVLKMFLLKAARPHKYRERVDVNHGGNVVLNYQGLAGGDG